MGGAAVHKGGQRIYVLIASRMEAIYLKMLEGKSPDASTTENSLETDVYDPIIQ